MQQGNGSLFKSGKAFSFRFFFYFYYMKRDFIVYITHFLFPLVFHSVFTRIVKLRSTLKMAVIVGISVNRSGKNLFKKIQSRKNVEKSSNTTQSCHIILSVYSRGEQLLWEILPETRNIGQLSVLRNSMNVLSLYDFIS